MRHGFTWEGYAFPQGRRVLLDLYGTDRDGRTWDEPEAFRSERFARWARGAFELVPQGGGDHYANHRCAGEWITIALVKKTAVFLTQRIRYNVPEQDLRIDYGRLPALPRSRFVIRDVRSAT